MTLLITLSWPTTHGQTTLGSTDNVRLTLTSQTVWGGTYGWCTFIVETLPNGGGMSRRCGGGGPVSGDLAVSGAAIRRRSLTESERATVRRLYKAARLFEGGHVGADLTAADLPFEMLVVRPSLGSGPAVALITVGNTSFASGQRKALLDWMRQEEMALQKFALSKE